VPEGVEIPEPMRKALADGTPIPGRAWVGAHLRGTSWFDLESGFLYGRDVEVEGFPRPMRASVQIRRLDPHAEVRLEPSGVRSPPPEEVSLLSGSH
jgi:hypothetical protein